MGCNSMGTFSKDLIDRLTEFMVCEIGSRAIDGVTYCLLSKTDADKERVMKYREIRVEADKCGFSREEIFRVHELVNGYIFDMDLLTARQITAEISKKVAQLNGGQTPIGNLLKDKPEKRKQKDLMALSKYLKTEYDKGVTKLEVALFSKNVSNKILITGKGPNGENLVIDYKAYAIKHWDIEALNENMLIPIGFRVKSIQPCEILPSKTGVSFIFILESMDSYTQQLNYMGSY